MKLIPSTMLDLARNPEDAFSAPLNTTKLAPVTDNEINNYLCCNPLIFKLVKYGKCGAALYHGWQNKRLKCQLPT